MLNDAYLTFLNLATRQHGVVSRRQAAGLGVDRHQLIRRIRRGELEEPLAGVVRVVGSPATWHQNAMIFVLCFRAIVSHRSAGWLHLLDGHEKGTGFVELSVPNPLRRAPDIQGLVLHRTRELEPADITVVNGLPVTNIARTLCDLGAVVPDDIVERGLDDALRRGCAYRWITDTLDRVDRPGPSGTQALRRVLALPDRSGRVPDSWRERLTERLLTHPELQPLERQYVIRDDAGRAIARPDLALVELRIGIEYHSDQWHYGPRRGRSDRRRDLAASRLGWELIYLDSTDHTSPDEALEAVLEVVRTRRAQFKTA